MDKSDTYKLGGFFVMNEKRYAIVRVDEPQHCPIYEGITGFCRDTGCDDCKMRENYGDTKEQLTLKIAQVLARKYLRDLKCATYTNSDVIANDVKNFYKLAKEIVEFLGVEE